MLTPRNRQYKQNNNKNLQCNDGELQRNTVLLSIEQAMLNLGG